MKLEAFMNYHMLSHLYNNSSYKSKSNSNLDILYNDLYDEFIKFNIRTLGFNPNDYLKHDKYINPLNKN